MVNTTTIDYLLIINGCAGRQYVMTAEYD